MTNCLFQFVTVFFNHDITPAMGTQLDCQFIECEIKQQYNH